MRNLLIIGFLLVLTGCQNEVEQREAQDDAYCRKVIVQRGDARLSAYQECRNNMMQYHEQKALAASGR